MSRITRYTLKIEWSDCDPGKIVFYPHYFKWFDNATDQLFDEVGLTTEQMVERYGVIGKPIAEASARFLLPSKYHQMLTIETRVESWEEKRFTLLHQGLRDGKLLLEGRETRFLGAPHPKDPNRLYSLPIPADLKALFD